MCLPQLKCHLRKVQGSLSVSLLPDTREGISRYLCSEFRCKRNPRHTQCTFLFNQLSVWAFESSVGAEGPGLRAFTSVSYHPEREQNSRIFTSGI